MKREKEKLAHKLGNRTQIFGLATVSYSIRWSEMCRDFVNAPLPLTNKANTRALKYLQV